MKYIKIIKFYNIKIRLITTSSFIANLISRQFKFGKFKETYKNYISISLHLEETSGFIYGRGDNFNTDKNSLSLECWLKNIRVDVYPDRNLIVGKILIPTTLPSEAILDLLIIHPLRHILKYKNIFMVHAACLTKNDKGVLICGSFKSGKSTLAVKLVEDGFKFLSDEFAIFNKGRLFSFPLKIGLESESIRIFPRLKKLIKKIKKGYEKFSFDIRDFYPDCCVESCIPEIIIFSKPQKKSKKVVIKSINKEAAFSLLCMDKDNSLLFEKNLPIRQKQIQALAALAEKTKSYYLPYSIDKIDKAAKMIDSLFISSNS